jgi:hypothetical protein
MLSNYRSEGAREVKIDKELQIPLTILLIILWPLFVLAAVIGLATHGYPITAFGFAFSVLFLTTYFVMKADTHD